MPVINPRLSALYEVKLIENKRSHFYQIENEDKWLPGVTTVLGATIPKPALLTWALNTMGENIVSVLSNLNLKEGFKKEEIENLVKDSKNIYKKKASDAADIGSRVHQAIDSIIKGEKKDIPEDIRDGVQGFLDWRRSNSLKIELGDTKIASRLFGYGGSLDMVAFENNEPIIFDFKTTKKRWDKDHGIYPEYGLQLSAYAMAFKETFGIPVKAVYALWLDKEKPGFKALRVSNINLCFESFLACLKLYSTQKFEMFDDVLIKETL